MDHAAMSLEDRLLALEFLVDSVLWGPHIENRAVRQQIAGHIFNCVEASQRHQAHPIAVQEALLRIADGLAEIDRIPDTLKPTLRTFVPPLPPGE